jgi:peptidoglycan/LPS O-acetylase OafA/YrhL
LEFLDGLRGLAAFCVVLFHVHSTFAPTGHDSRAFKWIYYGSLGFGPGRYAVAVFIVLSGYVLMLPVVTSGKRWLRNGFKDYIVRRARRILPPYYAVLALAMLVDLAVIARYGLNNIRTNHIRPGVTAGDYLSHLFLVHNVSPVWAFRINYPMWTVATEWQIYFLFPLLLLPLWRRFGIMAAVAAGFAVGLAVAVAVPATQGGCPWFLGLFALGVAGACLNFSDEPRLCALRDRAPWTMLTRVSGLLFLGTMLASMALSRAAWLRHEGHWVLDVLVGLWALCLIVTCARYRTWHREGGGPVIRLLESRTAVGLGTMSYSLYLTHALVLGVVHLVLLELRASPIGEFMGLLLVGVPLAILFSYGFYLGFERHFLPGHQRAKEIAAAR